MPARLQTALGLFETLRVQPSLDLHDHLAAKGSSGLASHETWGNKAHDLLGLEHVNKNHGRRSSSLQDWGQQLLEVLKAAGFTDAVPVAQGRMLDAAQAAFGTVPRNILEQEPLRVRLTGRNAEAVIRELMDQADAKGKTGDVSQYLVAAKLMLRLGLEVPVHPANKADRKGRHDREARLGEIEIADAIIEIAVGLPDVKHLEQVVEVLADTDKEAWLLTRAVRVKAWQDELEKMDGVDLKRVTVDSVDRIVGQYMTELRGFSARGRAARLSELVKLYNERWISAVGTPGIRIEIPG